MKAEREPESSGLSNLQISLDQLGASEDSHKHLTEQVINQAREQLRNLSQVLVSNELFPLSEVAFPGEGKELRVFKQVPVIRIGTASRDYFQDHTSPLPNEYLLAVDGSLLVCRTTAKEGESLPYYPSFQEAEPEDYVKVLPQAREVFSAIVQDLSSRE